MRETQSSRNSAFRNSFPPSSHGRRDSQPTALPVPRVPGENDEPPIQPSSLPHHRIVHRSANLSPISGFKIRNSGFSIEKIPFDREPIELAQYLRTSLRDGLAESEAQTRLNLYGKNILKEQQRYTVWTVLWKQVSNAMTVVLLAALIITFATKDYPEGGVIAGTVMLNSSADVKHSWPRISVSGSSTNTELSLPWTL